MLEGNEYLTKALRDNKLPNTLLFSGPEGVGKKKTALALADALLKGTKTDLHFLIPEGKSGHHTIEAIRSCIDISHRAPFEAKAKVFLIEAADRLQIASANALLKTLEEPVLDSYWILLSAKPQEILPTILSRCVKVPFYAQKKVAEKNEAALALLSALRSQPPYFQLHTTLERVEAMIETEDSTLYQKRVEELFLAIAEEMKEKEGWETSFDEMRLAFERNIKLTACLESFFLKESTQ